MNDHISFVETTYNTLRSPLNYFKNKVEAIMGTRSEKLPEIKNVEDNVNE